MMTAINLMLSQRMFLYIYGSNSSLLYSNFNLNKVINKCIRLDGKTQIHQKIKEKYKCVNIKGFNNLRENIGLVNQI
jgi:hypothetical protein